MKKIMFTIAMLGIVSLAAVQAQYSVTTVSRTYTYQPPVISFNANFGIHAPVYCAPPAPRRTVVVYKNAPHRPIVREVVYHNGHGKGHAYAHNKYKHHNERNNHYDKYDNRDNRRSNNYNDSAKGRDGRSGRRY